LSLGYGWGGGTGGITRTAKGKGGSTRLEGGRARLKTMGHMLGKLPGRKEPGEKRKKKKEGGCAPGEEVMGGRWGGGGKT